jgi:ribonuclease HI
MYIDGSLALWGVRAGILCIAPMGEEMHYMVQLQFWATNNMAEYEALQAGLWIMGDLKIMRLLVKGNSQLVMKHVWKKHECSDT